MLGWGLLANAPAHGDDIVSRLIEASDLTHQTPRLTDRLATALARQPDAGNAPAERALLTRLVTQRATPAAITAAMRNLLKDSDQPQALQAAQALEAPAIRKLLRLQLATGLEDPQGQRHFNEYLLRNPPTAERMALIERLIETGQDADFILAMQRCMDGLAAGLLAPLLATGAPSTLPPAVSASEGATDSRIFTQRRTALRALYFYRTATDTEIRQYLAFLDSGTGQWLLSTLRQSWLAAISSMGMTLASEITENRRTGRMISLIQNP